MSNLPSNKNPLRSAPTFGAVLRAHDDLVAKAGGSFSPRMGVITAADPEALVGNVELKTKTKSGWVFTFFYPGTGEVVESDEWGTSFVDTGMTEAESYFRADPTD
jgi:hypothetical protein